LIIASSDSFAPPRCYLSNKQTNKQTNSLMAPSPNRREVAS
jgi:hypothetical protein